MSYEWIKPGVKAEVFGLVFETTSNGDILKIADIDIECITKHTKELITGARSECGILYAYENLKPFNPPNWEGIADGSVKCKSVCTILKEIAPKVII